MNRTTRSQAFVVGLAFLFSFSAACSGDPVCSGKGSGVLLIPVALVDSISSVTTEGGADCRVSQRLGECGTSAACFEREGVLSRVFEVDAGRVGECSVTVTLSNGCSPKTAHFRFSGPHDGCCTATCETTGGTQLSDACD